MDTGWSAITKENTNFARLCKLLIDGGTHVLRVIFDAKHPPHDLKKHLMDSRIHNILKKLKAKKFLRSWQWNRLYPTEGSVTSAGFDISLLSLLLRNICNLPTPANGWDKEPGATSVNVEDDVVRLRLFRNNLYVITSEPALSDADFNTHWNDIETVLLRHGVDKTAIDSLKTQSFEPEDEDYYIKCLKEWITDEADRVIHEMKESEKRIPDLFEVMQLNPEPSKPATPEVLESYVVNLKESIAQHSTAFTDFLPRQINQNRVKTDDIFTNLTLHHGEKEILHRQTDPKVDQGARKMVTKLTQCREIFIDENKENNHKSILISGEPGIGKTLFSLKIVRDWSANTLVIPDIRYTYLIPFRLLDWLGNKELTLRELLNRSPLLNKKTMVTEDIMAHIIQHPEQLFIVLDGFDEYKDRDKIIGDFEEKFPNDVKAKMPVGALVSKLIRKKVLRDSLSMITSRPSEATGLVKQIHFDGYVEITGFSESQVIEYVEKYFKSRPAEVRKMAVNKVKRSPHHLSFGRAPFRCFVMCIFIEWEIRNNRDDSVPATLTKFYCDVIKCIERNYNRVILKLDQEAAWLAVDQTLDNLARLAAQLVEQNRFSFTSDDLENLNSREKELLLSSNLITCYPVSSDSPFPITTCEYSFTYFTIQEFLAAMYLVKKGVMPTQAATGMVYTFMSGLLGLDTNKKSMVELLECLSKDMNDNEYRLRVASLRCLHEFQDRSLTREELTTNRD